MVARCEAQGAGFIGSLNITADQLEGTTGNGAFMRDLRQLCDQMGMEIWKCSTAFLKPHVPVGTFSVIISACFGIFFLFLSIFYPFFMVWWFALVLETPLEMYNCICLLGILTLHLHRSIVKKQLLYSIDRSPRYFFN